MTPGGSLLWTIVLPALAAAAFVLPGWLVARRWSAPAPLLTGCLVSAALWFHLVLVCDLAGLRLKRSTLLGGWAVLCVAAVLLGRHLRSPEPRRWWQRIRPAGFEWVWLAAGAAGFASIAARALIDPLSGWDNLFRWDCLARAIVAHGNLHFYPPVQPADFEIYAWCDGIPPLVSLLNLWVYLVTGVMSPAVTAVRVAGEALLIGAAVFGLGRDLWGERGGWSAVGLLGTSSLFLWGVAMGQETGMLAVTLLALLWLLEKHRGDDQTGSVAWAGLAAGVGALSRDYGLALPLLGLAILAFRDRRPRNLLLFLALAALVAGPWYLRNWVRTGNPIFPLEIGGLFPTNPVYTEVMQRIVHDRSFGSNHINYGLLVETLAVIAGAALAAAAAGAAKAGRRSITLLAALLLTVALWAWSVPWTAGGLNYSLRVLTPAVALCAVLGGWLGSLRPGIGRAAALAAAVALSGDAARRAWLLPVFPRVSPLPWTFDDWRTVRLDLQHIEDNPLWDYLIRTAEGGLVAVDNPNAHVALVQRGGRTAMLFSPIFSGCFEANRPFEDVVRQLRQEQVRLVVLSVGDRVALSFIAAHPFFATLHSHYRPVVQAQSTAVYDLNHLTPAAP